MGIHGFIHGVHDSKTGYGGTWFSPFLEEQVWQMSEWSTLNIDLYGSEMDESSWGMPLLANCFNCDRTAQLLSTLHN
ncbi:hypothetical protein [Laspinema olomoucense]|uniref:Uncharacterized protein n=1 Tax=Laspinema olomoucense D3b TaxID=2953688 RepID=A0ABT2N9Y9_9CYAN|nr:MULTISPECIES: hypothetical protein [unclassified Laspinema]MCT7975403.1 hypothetical protein [Laspinema sp. D3d]MCT7978540.1 hypothetical protein [Laspinema sp. D3b]